MTDVVDTHPAPDDHPSPPRRGLEDLTEPGFVRAAWVVLLFWAIGAGIVVFFRWLGHYEPLWDWLVITVVALLTAAPVGFLAGIGSFDYWLYYISGRPTVRDYYLSHGAYSWRDYFNVNTDHKVIGVQYLVMMFFFFVVGGLMAMIFRAELANPDMQYVDTQTFNGLVSEHAALMIFLFIIPAFAGLANFCVLLMLGAPDMAFPRLNALSFWLLPIAGMIFLSAFLAPGGAFGAGWTGYVLLAVEGSAGNMFFQMGVQLAGASSIMTALNFLVTIITMRAPGMTFWRLPLLVWANFTTSLLVVIATPFIAGSQFFGVFDLVVHRILLQRLRGRLRGLVPAHLLVLLASGRLHHDAARVRDHLGGDRGDEPQAGVRLPADGAVTDGDPRARLLGLGAPHVRGRDGAVAARADDGHVDDHRGADRDQDFFLAGDDVGGEAPFPDADAVCARLPLDVRVGGLSGIFLASVPIDIAASDTYFIVAHIHYVLFGGSVFTIFAGIYYWFPKMTGRMYGERLGKLHFWLTFIGFNGTFFPMHWVGLQGMPRRVADYSAEFGNWNLVISLFSFLLGASTIVFFYNVIVSWARGPIAPSNPWRALTLEWQVSLPPPVFNFDEIPQVVGGPYEYGVPGARHAVLDGGAQVWLPEDTHEEGTVR